MPDAANLSPNFRYLSCKGECQKWWARVSHGALENSHFGISLQLQRKMGWPFRGMPRSAFAPAAPVFWRKPCENLSGPWDCMHLPVAAGLQEENCRCACRQCERLRLHFKHLLSGAHKSQPWPKKELPACNFACLLLTIDIRHAGVHGRCDMTVQSLTVCPFCRCADQTSLVLTTGRVIDVAGSMAGLYCRLECIRCPQLCIIAMW